MSAYRDYALNSGLSGLSNIAVTRNGVTRRPLPGSWQPGFYDWDWARCCPAAFDSIFAVEGVFGQSRKPPPILYPSHNAEWQPLGHCCHSSFDRSASPPAESGPLHRSGPVKAQW